MIFKIVIGEYVREIQDIGLFKEYFKYFLRYLECLERMLNKNFYLEIRIEGCPCLEN